MLSRTLSRNRSLSSSCNPKLSGLLESTPVSSTPLPRPSIGPPSASSHKCADNLARRGFFNLALVTLLAVAADLERTILATFEIRDCARSGNGVTCWTLLRCIFFITTRGNGGSGRSFGMLETRSLITLIRLGPAARAPARRLCTSALGTCFDSRTCMACASVHLVTSSCGTAGVASCSSATVSSSGSLTVSMMRSLLLLALALLPLLFELLLLLLLARRTEAMFAPGKVAASSDSGEVVLCMFGTLLRLFGVRLIIWDDILCTCRCLRCWLWWTD